MAWHFPQSGTTSPTLVDDDDVFIAQQVFLNGVIHSGVTDGHEVIVAGTVASYGDAIVLGFYPGGGPNSVTVEATGQVRAFEGNSIRLFGDGQQIVNHGLIAQEASAIVEAVAASFRSDGPLPATSSSFINTGIVNADASLSITSPPKRSPSAIPGRSRALKTPSYPTDRRKTS
ncbi:hypothetical protein [Mesorhizobium sp. CN2-181]|uniref:hypothetical protein n=1 Tax=Mesorhizobium yinganensis TaxID=3157707 RepID=UPI0032B71A05